MSEHSNTAQQFIHWAQDNQEFCSSIFISIPVAPGHGIDPALSDMLKVWASVGIWSKDTSNASSGFIEAVRAGMAWNFMKNSEFKYLIMIDADMVPTGEDIWLPYLLARHDEPVVGGLCAVLPDDVIGTSLVMTLKDEAGEWRMPRLFNDRGELNMIPSAGLLEVGHCGTGLICISRKCLEAFSWDKNEPDGIPFFIDDTKRKDKFHQGLPGIGEDMYFCQQVRDLGMSVHVDLEARIGHRKASVLKVFEEQRDPCLDPSKWVLPAEGIRVGEIECPTKDRLSRSSP